MTDPPSSTQQIDTDLARTIRRDRQVAPFVMTVLTVAIIFLVGMCSYLFVNARGERTRTNNTIRHNTDSTCALFRDIGTSVLPVTGTEFGTQIVVDSRNITFDLGCSPRIGPADQSVIDLAAKYHLHLKG